MVILPMSVKQNGMPAIFSKSAILIGVLKTAFGRHVEKRTFIRYP